MVSRMASALGIKQLGLLVGACMLFGGLHDLRVSQLQQSLNSAGQGTGAQTIVQAALNIVAHMSMTTSNPNEAGSVFTLYNTQDAIQNPYPPMDQPKLLQFWSQGNENLYNIQCAGFVAAALYMADHPMVQPLGEAHWYWDAPGNSFPASDWQYVMPVSGGVAPPQGIQTTRGMPLPGDLAVFSGNETNSPGHVAIVIAANPPANTGDQGKVVLAQANFPPNYYTNDPTLSIPRQVSNPVPWLTAKDIPLYVAPLLPGGDIALDGDITHPDKQHQLLGFIRNIKAQQLTQQMTLNLPTGSCGPLRKRNLPNSPWVQVAADDATAQGLDPAFFVNQIDQESHFDPKALSSTGAEGIAQFEPYTAPSWGVTNPWDPQNALPGAVKFMLSLYSHFSAKGASPREVCALALAGYNCGEGCVDNSIATCGQNWYACLPSQTINYIPEIMGTPASNNRWT